MASTYPFPFIPMKSTETLLQSFDPDIYAADSSSLLYKYLDAMVGSAGVGSLLNQMFLTNLGNALQTIYFNELDYIFGNMSFLARTAAEAYPYTPATDMLTSEQWDEVRVKDSWYRSRVQDFFTAIGLGGTPEGIRECVKAAVACDCNVFEVWRYIDNFGLTTGIGRAPAGGNRNEVVVQPLKSSLEPAELRLCRDMLDRMLPIETVVTVNPEGLAISTPVEVSAVAADSSYYEVQKMVTATPLLAQMPPPEFLPIDLLPSEQWLYRARVEPQLAPYAAFNISQEYGYYYLVSGGRRSPINAVTYGTLSPDGSVATAPNYSVYQSSGSFTPWTPYDKGDSPDNYPGGKFGVHPTHSPAINPDGTDYRFSWDSQLSYIAAQIVEITKLGGKANQDRYCLPAEKSAQAQLVYYPSEAIAFSPPCKGSTVTKSITNRRGRQGTTTGTWSNPSIFVRS